MNGDQLIDQIFSQTIYRIGLVGINLRQRFGECDTVKPLLNQKRPPNDRFVLTPGEHARHFRLTTNRRQHLRLALNPPR